MPDTLPSLRVAGTCQRSGQLDFHVHAGSQIQLHQRVDRLRRRLHNVKHTLVGTDLELLARLLVDVRATVDRELLDARRHGNGAANKGTGAARGIGDVAGRLIEHTMIERLQANADILRFHNPTDAKERGSSPNRHTGREPGRRLKGRLLLVQPKTEGAPLRGDAGEIKPWGAGNLKCPDAI